MTNETRGAGRPAPDQSRATAGAPASATPAGPAGIAANTGWTDRPGTPSWQTVARRGRATRRRPAVATPPPTAGGLAPLCRRADPLRVTLITGYGSTRGCISKGAADRPACSRPQECGRCSRRCCTLGTLTRQGRQNWRLVVSVLALAGRGRIILRRKVAVRLPSAARRILASSQFPYSAWSVRIRRATSLDVLRGRLSIRYEYSVITTYCARRWR
jgi:hypothetical protein